MLRNKIRRKDVDAKPRRREDVRIVRVEMKPFNWGDNYLGYRPSEDTPMQ